ncbi:hypothetical protein [Streptomyces europaeiscabiei]|uniref:hypothetical protein n=1 Tax=Streptomyces europaeiscabiei TaxID=146819 RepID=UPI0038F6DC69
MIDSIVQPTPVPFRVGSALFVRLPRTGLCRMGSWGWEPVPEGVLETYRAIEAMR